MGTGHSRIQGGFQVGVFWEQSYCIAPIITPSTRDRRICYVLTLIPGMPPWARPVFGLVALIIVLVWLIDGGSAVSLR
jgi:hypothetical protein